MPDPSSARSTLNDVAAPIDGRSPVYHGRVFAVGLPNPDEPRFLHEPDPERAWSAFVEDTMATIDRAARRVVRDDPALADDIAADVLDRIRRDWPDLLERFEACARRASFRTWLAVVARNLAIDLLRARQGRIVLPKSVSRLPVWQRELWRLVVVEDRSLTDAAERLRADGHWDGDLASLAEALEAVRDAAVTRARTTRATVKFVPTGEPETPEPEADEGDAPDARHLHAAAIARWAEILRDFDPEDRRIVRVYFLEESTAAQTASALGLSSADQVYERVKRILQRLRERATAAGLGPVDLASLVEFDWVRHLSPRGQEPGGEGGGDGHTAGGAR